MLIREFERMESNLSGKIGGRGLPSGLVPSAAVAPSLAPKKSAATLSKPSSPKKVALTGIPRTESELQLFRVLQRGNLLAYFDVMIELGGDDVQQLCEAGEEEFLEIMALIGMASKPLHVRRLQKALQEWMSNPALFQTPVLPPGVALNGPQAALTPSSSPPALPQIPQTRTSPQPQHPIRPIPYHHSSPSAAAIAQHHNKLTISTVSNGHGHHSSNSNSPNGSTRSPHNINDHSANGYRNGELRIPLDQLIPSHFLEQRIRTNSQPASPAPSDSPSESSSHSPVPFLQDHELVKIAHAAGQIVKTLPPYVFTPQIPSKRKFSGDYEAIIRLPPNDPRRVEEMRRMSTIYGRADSSSSTVPNKRKYPKPLSMHEVAVNEAAGQLVRHVPALLTYRDELCALAKQVVRDSGLSLSASSANNSVQVYSQLNNNSSAYSNQNKNKELTNGHSSASVEPYSGAKRLRLGDHGLEIQEYSRPPSNHSNSSNDEGNGLQITPISHLPQRVSSASLSPLPLELVTVSSNSPPRRGSGDIGRRGSGSSSSDLNPQAPKNGLRVTSVGVTGGSINISHDPSIRVTSSSPNAPSLLPVKAEPPTN